MLINTLPFGVFGAVLTAVSLDGIPIVQPGLAGLVVIGVLMIFNGKLVPYPMYRDKCDQVTEQKEEIKFLRAQVVEQSEQLRVVSEVGRTVERVMLAVDAAPNVGKAATP